MGVFLPLCFVYSITIGLPHARGGVSRNQCSSNRCRWSSPRPWGCFLLVFGFWMHQYVFPTPVGVFPEIAEEAMISHGLPHARGGVSEPPSPWCLRTQSSPRPWGCFRIHSTILCMAQVFPTPVGVFLTPTALDNRVLCLPHARGGVSKRQAIC